MVKVAILVFLYGLFAVGSGAGTCPETYPYVYYNGQYCCETNKEKSYGSHKVQSVMQAKSKGTVCAVKVTNIPSALQGTVKTLFKEHVLKPTHTFTTMDSIAVKQTKRSLMDRKVQSVMQVKSKGTVCAVKVTNIPSVLQGTARTI